MSGKISVEGNVQQPAQDAPVTRGRAVRRTGEHSRLSEPQAAQGTVGVEVLSKSARSGVSIESKRDGGSLETKPELGGDLNDRDTDGRRKFA